MSLQYREIAAITGLTKTEYQKLMVSTLLSCLNHVFTAYNSNSIQKSIIDPKVNRWFLKQVAKVNRDFLNDIPPYRELKQADLKVTYKAYLKKAYRNYPYSLIQGYKQAIKPNEYRLN